MTTSRDLERVLEHYLVDGPTELPDRSYDEVRTSIDHIQQRVVIGPWRTPLMPNLARLAVIGLVVFTISLGLYLAPRQSQVGGPEPSPTASASPALLPDQNVPNFSAKPLAAGVYSITDPAITNAQLLTYAVPEGWSTSQAYLVKHLGDPGYVMLTPYVVSHVYPDPCHHNDSEVVSAGTTVDDLVNALSSQASRAATAPVDVTVAGFPGKQIVLTQDNLDVTTCTNGALRYWPDAGPDFSGGLCCDPAGNIDVVDVIDVSGHRLALVARHYPGSSDADKAELQGIIDSIQIVPLPATASPLPVGSADATPLPASPSPAG